MSRNGYTQVSGVWTFSLSGQANKTTATNWSLLSGLHEKPQFETQTSFLLCKQQSFFVQEQFRLHHHGLSENGDIFSHLNWVSLPDIEFHFFRLICQNVLSLSSFCLSHSRDDIEVAFNQLLPIIWGKGCFWIHSLRYMISCLRMWWYLFFQNSGKLNISGENMDKSDWLYCVFNPFP